MVIHAKEQQKVQSENEPNNCQVKNISIDPKTWVKLGHFHLLLEEYRKGKMQLYQLFIYMTELNFQLCLPIRCFTKHKLKITGKIQHFFMVLDLCIFISMLFSGKLFFNYICNDTEIC